MGADELAGREAEVERAFTRPWSMYTDDFTPSTLGDVMRAGFELTEALAEVRGSLFTIFLANTNCGRIPVYVASGEGGALPVLGDFHFPSPVLANTIYYRRCNL